MIPIRQCQLLVAAPAAAPVAAAAAAWQQNLRLDSPQPMPGGDPPKDERGCGGDSNTEREILTPSLPSSFPPPASKIGPLGPRVKNP